MNRRGIGTGTEQFGWRARLVRRRVMLAATVAAVLTATPFVAQGPATLAAGAHAQASTVTVVASGLNNPRSISVDAFGNLWVTEAGKGGPDCVATPGAPTNPTCFGLTGSIDRIQNGRVIRVFTTLASLAAQDGTEALGPAGISALGSHLYFDFDESSLGLPLGLYPWLTARLSNQLGELMEADLYEVDRAPVIDANVGNFDFEWTNLHKQLGNGEFPDADPYGIQAASTAAGQVVYVADAGANTVDEVSPTGRIKLLAFIPNPPSGNGNGVPTCVAQGPGGALYIGELTGAGNGPTAAKVFRWTASTGLTVWQAGFSTIDGCGFGSDGSFYVTEFDTTGFPPSGPPAGEVIKIARDGSRTVLGAGQLFAPNGFAAGPDGSIYVTNWSVLPGSSSNGGPTGEVVRITS